jgi:hypothetical protein
MDENTPELTPEGPAAAPTGTAPGDDTPETAEGDSAAESFDRSYVEKLRAESAKYRTRAGQTDELAQRLHVELVKATGRLADPTELPFSEAHLTDPEALQADLDALIAAKPHYAARRPVPGTTVGQGVQGDPPKQKTNLIGALRSAHGWQ